MKNSSGFLSGLILLLVTTSCAFPARGRETDLPNPTKVYATVSANLTAMAGLREPTAIHKEAVTPSPVIANPTPSRPVTVTIAVDTPDSGKSSPSATLTQIPCNLAAPGRPFVDVNIPDGAEMLPGQQFSKTWRLVNAGSCTWTSAYAIIWFSGENFSLAKEQPFSNNVKTGQSVDITVDMVAPKPPGIHQSNWKLRDARGALFGIGPNGDAPFWVRIEVKDIATQTMTPQPTTTLTATPGALARGSLELEPGEPADLDSGKVKTGVGDDVELQKLTATTFQLAPLNGAKLADVGGLTPTDLDCRASALSDKPVPNASLVVGRTFCYRTTQGLPGYLRIRSLALKENQITVDFLTWAIP